VALQQLPLARGAKLLLSLARRLGLDNSRLQCSGPLGI
jgi:hypothetical protein